jgi:hypothetical protein
MKTMENNGMLCAQSGVVQRETVDTDETARSRLPL